MSKLLYITQSLFLIIVICLVISNPISAHVINVAEKEYRATTVKLTDDVLKQRLKNISSEVEYEVTREVRRRIKEYTVLYPESSKEILGRVILYFPMFEKEIYKRKLPDELKYVAVVESLLRPEGTSKSGAAGLWQILRSTGRWLGLEINGHIDERRDPEKSTEAALGYLQSLYEEFEDWTLAIAAYNCGPGNMRKAIRRSGKRDYWSLRNYLPRETQEYIPRVVAAAYLMNYYHLHNLQPKVPDQDLRFISEVEVDQQLSFKEIETKLDLEKGLIKKINPAFVYPIAGKSNLTSKVNIPSSKYMEYLLYYQPETYAVIKAEQEQRLLEERARELQLSRRDSIRHIEKIVVNFIQYLKPERERMYHIPHAMRSNLSYLRA